jgi:hypothetical protein
MTLSVLVVIPGPLPVIPGHDEGVSPESIPTSSRRLRQRRVMEKIVDMDSGLAAARRPGMTRGGV